MTRVVLGNRHAVHSRDDGETTEALPKGKRATVIDVPADQSPIETLKGITDPGGIWAAHSTEGAVPAWVASNDGSLAALLATHYGGIEVRELEDVTDKHGTVLPGGSVLSLSLSIMLFGLFMWLLGPFLKTNAGNDFQYAQMAGSASATAVGKWVALTANVTAPAAGDTTLTGEIVTGGGGLIRKAGTPAHTTGAASYTITTVFTANGSDSLPVTIGKRGIFDASASGNMVFETLVSPTATLSASGDALTLTDTITM